LYLSSPESRLENTDFHSFKPYGALLQFAFTHAVSDEVIWIAPVALLVGVQELTKNLRCNSKGQWAFRAAHFARLAEDAPLAVRHLQIGSDVLGEGTCDRAARHAYSVALRERCFDNADMLPCLTSP
jgi:hypothetical protein